MKKVKISQKNEGSQSRSESSIDNSKQGNVSRNNVFEVDINLVEPHHEVMKVYLPKWKNRCP